MKSTLGRLESQLIAYCQMRGKRTVATGDLLAPLQLTAKQERELLSRMERGGMIARVRRGLYLVPSRLPLGGAWVPDEALAINTLMRDAGATYQVCGPAAFNFYGFDDQIPNRLIAYNDRISGDRTIGNIELTLIEVSEQRLGETETVQASFGEAITYSSRTRTLFDAVYDWARFHSLPRGYRWIRNDLRTGRVDAVDLARVTVAFGNQGTIRRIGALLEEEQAPPDTLEELQSALNQSKSVIAAVPGASRRGSLNKRWGVIDNEDR